jgi:RecB family endonuclease NucS
MPVIKYYSSSELTLERSIRLLNNAVAEKQLVFIPCRCSVHYTGRSRSILPEGDRVVIIKEDGAVLIHRPRGYSPINWQPSTMSISFEEENNHILLKAIRRQPRETMYVTISMIYGILIAGGMVDNAKFSMIATEEEIKNVMENAPWLIEDGLKITGREVRISEGIIDFIGRDKKGGLVIIEVKDERAGIDSAKQLLRYVMHYRINNPTVRGILVAPAFSKGAIEFLARNGLEKKILKTDKILAMLREKANERTGERSILDFMRTE